MRSIIKNIIVTSGIVIVLWIVGIAAMLPVIPFVETDFYAAESDIPLSEGFPVTITEHVLIKLEMPKYYSENEQCIDFWFTSSKGKHMLTVNNFFMGVRNITGSEVKRLSSSLFWTGGSEEGVFEIKDYEIEETNYYDKDRYVIFRSCFDVSEESVFSITIKADYLVDGVQRKIDMVLTVEKRKRLIWHEFRFH